jgi:hypothetical protein
VTCNLVKIAKYLKNLKKKKKNIFFITRVVLVPHQCAMRPTDLDNNPLLLCHCTYDPNLLFPLFFQKELKSVETVGKALHQLRRIIFLPYILSYIQSETNFIAVKQPKESKDSKLAELTKDYKRV